MCRQVEEDLTGSIEVAREQVARSPMTWLEATRTDAVMDYFKERGEEPNYEEIASMVAPFKYVNSQFKVYPLVLGDAGHPEKIRFVSDASELQLDVREEYPSVGIDNNSHWFGSGMRVTFHVANGGIPCGCQPQWQDGYLPVVEWNWEQAGVRYHLEAFATCLPGTAEFLCAWLQITIKRLDTDVPALFGAAFHGQSPLRTVDNYLTHVEAELQPLRAGFSDGWQFDTEKQQLTYTLPVGQNVGHARLIVANRAAPTGTLLEWPGIRPAQWAISLKQAACESGLWMAECAEANPWLRTKKAYCEGWNDWLANGAQVQTPEAVVNHAHQSVRISSQIIATRSQMSYSTQNAYERLYTDESSQAILGLAYWGHHSDAHRYLGQLPFYSQRNVTAFDLGSRLSWFCRYAEISGDSVFMDVHRKRMRRWAQELAENIQPEPYGLGAPEALCGDLHQAVYSLSANSMAWRGMKSYAVLYGDGSFDAIIERYRDAICQAAEETIDNTCQPPFLPISLYGNDPTPDSLTNSTLGSYWCLMAPYVLFSNVLGKENKGAQAILDSYKYRGGLCGGLVRWTPGSDYTSLTILSEMALDDLYGAKLSEFFARLDEPDQLILALYGKLGLGLTPHTFIAGEGGSLAPSRVLGDESNDGRSMYLPPNTASQMMYAIVLRHCLIFDFDSQDDGQVDTLRLAFSTPRRWLQDGKEIKVKDMPTAFGTVSYCIQSHIESQKIVKVKIRLPTRKRPLRVHLRLRIPIKQDRKLLAVTVNDLPYDNFDPTTEVINISSFQGEVQLTAQY
jgi:hypothetical protein